MHAHTVSSEMVCSACNGLVSAQARLAATSTAQHFAMRWGVLKIIVEAKLLFMRLFSGRRRSITASPPFLRNLTNPTLDQSPVPDQDKPAVRSDSCR